ncbi:putative membrane protein [Lactobacillus colini]|uniref:Membrane protein n=1 Tax=Lactobacillus colini TaxID=1819254 RepID=A0ABS4MCY3_9LACO|nr:PTS sugar transporter subunit IIC [Lactobacillus colini]MBP2057547.1 putative membrane protein [Lactobacillus colini]
MKEKFTIKDFAMNILNGIAIGVVVVLVPGALLSELVKVLLPSMPALSVVQQGLNLANSMMGLVCGILVGLNFKFSPIQAASLGLAVEFSAGAIKAKDGALILSGTGDIINMMIVAAIGAGVILLVADRLKAYTILIIPTLLLVVVGSVGVIIAPYVARITELIGIGIKQLLGLQPMLMCILLAVVFGVLIVSPITTVGIALAISLAGIGSGAANVGICATGFAFAILGWRVNSHGISIAHFLGSPKISMPVIARNPKTLIPIICSNACSGLVAYIFQVKGTPMSAGFGFSGLVGPINNLNLASGGWSMINILITTLVYAVFPIIFGLIFKKVFVDKLHFVNEEDYRLSL